MERTIFSQEHEMFRKSFRSFVEKEIMPYHEQWEKDGIVPRELWLKAGAQGFLCSWIEEEYGGVGADFLYGMIVAEELAQARASGVAFTLHSDIVAPYIHHYGSAEQKKRWLPGCASGEKILAIAMTEPGAGSDLASIRTTAIRDGDHYVINGQKTFISNGLLCDLLVVAAKTDPKADPPYRGVSLLVVEAGTAGFNKGRKLEKMGLKAQDTAELSFDDCLVPVTNLLGDEGQGFYFLMQQLAQERLMVAFGAQAGAERILEMTIKYCQERTAFGRPVARFQNTRFKLAELATELELGRVFLDRLAAEHASGKNLPKEASMAKWWITELLKKTADECLQFFGGYGYMLEYPISKAFLDARVNTIYAGTTEIMKEIIARQMGL